MDKPVIANPDGRNAVACMNHDRLQPHQLPRSTPKHSHDEKVPAVFKAVSHLSDGNLVVLPEKFTATLELETKPVSKTEGVTAYPQAKPVTTR